MTDRFDQAYTLNFTSIASVRGPLSEAALQRALRCLEQRHPLLTARIDRSAEPRFLSAEAAPIPLQVEEAPVDALLARADLTLLPCAWQDAGPHAELIWLRHGTDHASLLLRQHHTVSDGSSGILLMRDLLSFLAQASEPEQIQPLPSPGQDAFFPEDFAVLRAQALAALQQRPPAAREVLRVRRFDVDDALEHRRTSTRRLRLDRATSQALAQQARLVGATVHGVLIAAIARAIARETGQDKLQRIVHPLDLRRYLRELAPSAPPIGDAVGYYVSSVTTEHLVEAGGALGELARAITQAVRAGKAAREPLLSAPVRGPFLVERTQALEVSAFRQLAEQKLFANTFGISNLGPLERLGVQPQVGALQVEDFFFVAASSVMNQLGGSAVGFDGRTSLQLSCLEPLVPEALRDTVHAQVSAQLTGFSQGNAD